MKSNDEMRSTDPAMLGDSGYKRLPNDSYYTPRWVTEVLVRHVHFPGAVWECAAGGGDMSTVLRQAGYRVVESDITWEPSVDFLRQTVLPEGVRLIPTNPPYGPPRQRPSLTELFIRHALDLTEPVDGVVAMLSKTEFDGAKTRTDLFDRPPFAKKIVLTDRPWWVERKKGDPNPRMVFAWYIWDWLHIGKPVIEYDR